MVVYVESWLRAFFTAIVSFGVFHKRLSRNITNHTFLLQKKIFLFKVKPCSNFWSCAIKSLRNSSVELGFVCPQYISITTGSFIFALNNSPRMGQSRIRELLNNGNPSMLICKRRVQPSTTDVIILEIALFRDLRIPKVILTSSLFQNGVLSFGV